ncbi:hypothetical protein ACF8O8_15205 [Pseudomonas sp. TYF_14]|uniref:hypothetical protein n=1 Tax=Pseudomonas sp. TYF_14 TaxID=3367193 RepID=UPI00370C29DB
MQQQGRAPAQHQQPAEQHQQDEGQVQQHQGVGGKAVEHGVGARGLGLSQHSRVA